jgi:uncharacterized glyoxalase superfamily protein PhnB
VENCSSLINKAGDRERIETALRFGFSIHSSNRLYGHFRRRHGNDALSTVASALARLDRISPGEHTLALSKPSRTAADPPTPNGSASLQLAFKVSAAGVDQCADELVRQGVSLPSPPTDQLFGHRTLFFRDPDGIYWR